jgi:hypothetical protein
MLWADLQKIQFREVKIGGGREKRKEKKGDRT